jgi:hypothetical protein
MLCRSEIIRGPLRKGRFEICICRIDFSDDERPWSGRI